MEKENCNYCIDIQFNEPTTYPSGAKIYCNDFKIAVERMITFGNLNWLFDGSSAELIKGREIKEMKLFIVSDGSIELERKMETERIGSNTEGLYYHFPKGISDFEQKSGLDFSGYRGYDTRGSFLQASYLDLESGKYKDLLAQEAMMLKLQKDRAALPYYSATISRQQFASPFPEHMNLYPLPFSEILLDRDPNIVLKSLLQHDFNELDKALAYEQDFTTAITRATMEFNGHKRAKLQSYRRNFYHNIIKEPGIYLEFLFLNNEKGMFKFPYDSLTPMGMQEQIFRVGSYDSQGIKVQKVPELLEFLERETISNSKSQKAVSHKASPKKLLQKAKGRSSRM
ncbi:hypothetical protein A9970_01950 [Sphingobacterium sp. UME9]|nr:hypothetical protein [Sphingobacterium sp. UME9]OFV09576.1 hypothetical protein HMPREF3127_23210 [Sphingobacterium sp. HMSC13C05]